MADRLCRCGCDQVLPPRNKSFINAEHHGTYLRASGRAKVIGTIGGKASFAPGGGCWEKYLERRRVAVQQLVPLKQTFTRAEVLRLCVVSDTAGYHRGYAARAARERRGMVAS